MKNFIKNNLGVNNNTNKDLNNSRESEKQSPFQILPKIVNEFVGGIKGNPNEISDIALTQGNADLISENDTWINSEIKNGKLIEAEKIICMGNCHQCIFIRAVLDDLFQREVKFNIYQNYMLNNYVETYILNKNLDYNIQFSNYLDITEGTNRIRNRFKIKVDKVSNYEIQETKNIIIK